MGNRSSNLLRSGRESINSQFSSRPSSMNTSARSRSLGSETIPLVDSEPSSPILGDSDDFSDFENYSRYHEHNGSRHSAEDDTSIIPKGALDPVYESKARVLNRAIADIGMGWYQWQLFIVVGFGWAVDNIWPIVTSLILPAVAKEFNVEQPPLLTLAQSFGLVFGAIFWGFGCDIFGRKIAFNMTLGLTAFWGMVAAGASSFAAASIFVAFWSFGVGGNLPVDSAIFLEFLPQSHQYLMMVLSIDWAVAQVVVTLVAWPLLGNMTCSEEGAPCSKEDNMGWRYFVLAMGGVTLLMFLGRFVFFHIHESPKYLIGKGLDDQAVRIVHEIARRNGKTSHLTVEALKACEPDGYSFNKDTTAVLKRGMEEFGTSRVKPLFATRQLALSTGAIMLIWAFLGLAFPLYNSFLPYIQLQKGIEFGDASVYLAYRNDLIIAVFGVPGAVLSGILSELPSFGRKGTLSAATILTGIFLYASTTASTSNALLGWNCGFNFSTNLMYSVLYGYTPEIFPTPQRGTGNALTAMCNRIFGLMAPIIAIAADINTPAPVYTSGALFFAAGLVVLILPFESRGKAAL